MAKTAAPALSQARQMLKQTLEAKQPAVDLADKAQAVVDAAHAAVELARSESAKRDETGADVIKERLDALKGERPAKSAEEIRAAQRERIIAKEELLTSDLTLQAAQQEWQQAHGNVARVQKVANSHATACLSESVTVVISQWDAVNVERERLRVILDSLVVARVALDMFKPEQQHQTIQSAVSAAGLPFGDYQDWKHLQSKVGAGLSHNYAMPDPGPGIARARSFWASFADALLADPAAEQPQLPGAAELFG